MELVYVFCPSYLNLKNKEVNFNPQYEFKYEPDGGRLLFVHSKEEINIFKHARLDNISNVNAIVGGNGSGKTTFINFIMETFGIEFTRSIGIKKLQYIIIFCDDTDGNKHFYVYSNNIDVNIQTNQYGGMIIEKMKNSRRIFERYDPHMCLIFYTNAFSFSEYKRNTGSILRSIDNKLYNVSLINRLQDVYAKEKKVTDPILRAYHEMVFDQIAAWESADLPFERPKLHIIFDSNAENALEEILNSIPNSIEINTNVVIDVCGELFRWDKNTRSQVVLRGIVYSMIKWVLNEQGGADEKKILLSEVMESWRGLLKPEQIQSEKINEYSINAIVSNTFECIDGQGTAHEKHTVEYKKLISMLLNNDIVSFEPGYGFYMLGDGNETKLSEFFTCYLGAILHVNGFLSFEWNMSTGEYARFDLYSQLYKLGSKTQEKEFNKRLRADSFLLMIDEVDLYIHPQWQQEFVYTLLRDINKLFVNKKVQVIIATHSPIVLSDIPSKHVIYFPEIAEKRETFAANIYNLYNDSFYLSKNIFVVGKFACELLKGIYRKWGRYISRGIEELEEHREDIEHEREIVEMIGEPLIKHIFLKRYAVIQNIVGNNESIDVKKVLKDYFSKEPEEQERIKMDILNEE